MSCPESFENVFSDIKLASPPGKVEHQKNVSSEPFAIFFLTKNVHNFNHSQLNKRLPYFFRDRSTEYFGLIHAALFGSETVEVEEAEKLLGISKETVAQLKQYEEEREDMEASHFRASKIVSYTSLDL